MKCSERSCKRHVEARDVFEAGAGAGAEDGRL